jgi:class 3 adenylate cyclase
MGSRAEASMGRGGELVAASAELRTENFKAWAGGADTATVALVFTDVVGSTKLNMEVGDEHWQHVREAHFAQTRRLVAQYRGYVIKTIGDSSIAAFRSADRALDYALALQANSGHPQVRIRAGVHIGPVQVEENDVFGGVVNLAARITGYVGSPGVWLSDRAKADLETVGEPRHARLRWERHDDVKMKGFADSFTLWGWLRRPTPPR